MYSSIRAGESNSSWMYSMRSIISRRFDDERKRNVVSMFNAPAISSSEERSLNAVKRENLLRNCFVLGHENGMWTGAGVSQSKQVDVGDHVHFLGVVTVERLGQVENEVGIAARE